MRRQLCIVLVAMLFVAACGARLSDDQQAALEGASSTEEQTETIVTAIASPDGDPTADGPSQVVGGPRNDGQAGPVDRGSEDHGEGGQVVEAGGSRCAGGGASDVGVTEDEIKIGNVSTISGAVPGFGQTGVNGVQAYMNFVNANGGVCGRRLSLVTGDDRLQPGTNRSETEKLANEVLGFVGGTTVVDGGAAQVLEGTNIAETGLAITDAMIVSPNHFPTTPINLERGGNNAAAGFRYMAEVEGVGRAALIWPEQASARARMDGYRDDLRAAGIEIVMESAVDVIHTNYMPQARNIEQARADIVITTLEISGMANLARAMHQNGYMPKVPFYGAQVYGRDFISLAGAAAEGTKVAIPHAILEDAGVVQAIDDLIEWYARTNPGSEMDFFTFQGWAAADMYVTALAGVEGPPTRDAVLANLRAMTSFNANGMLADINPADKTTPGCFIVAEVRGGQWMRTHPSSGFECGYA